MSAIGAADHPTAQAARWQPPSTSTRASYTRSARTNCRDARSSSARLQVETRVRPLGMVTGALLDPEGMAIQAVRTFASGHLISGLLRRFLPAPWNVLARVLGNLIALPLGLQQAALGLVVGTTVPASTPAASTRAASPVSRRMTTDPSRRPHQRRWRIWTPNGPRTRAPSMRFWPRWSPARPATQ